MFAHQLGSSKKTAGSRAGGGRRKLGWVGPCSPRGRLDKEDNASSRQKASVRGIGEIGDKEESRAPMPFSFEVDFKIIQCYERPIN